MAVCVKNYKRLVDAASGYLEGHPRLYTNVAYGLCTASSATPTEMARLTAFPADTLVLWNFGLGAVTCHMVERTAIDAFAAW